MPAESEAQRRYLYATKGEEWVKAHHFDTKGKLPEHVADSAGSKDASKKEKPRKKNPLLEALGQ